MRQSDLYPPSYILQSYQRCYHCRSTGTRLMTFALETVNYTNVMSSLTCCPGENVSANSISFFFINTHFHMASGVLRTKLWGIETFLCNTWHRCIELVPSFFHSHKLNKNWCHNISPPLWRSANGTAIPAQRFTDGERTSTLIAIGFHKLHYKSTCIMWVEPTST